MTDKVIRVKIEAGDSQQQIAQLDTTMVKLGASTDKAATEIVELNTDLTKTAQGVKAAISTTTESISNLNKVTSQSAQSIKSSFSDAGSNVGNFGRQAGQAGMQVQQLVGQITAGTNPLVAFSQQAADIGFVLGAPLLGAVVGIAAAIGSVLVPSLIGGATEAEKLDDALKDLRSTSGTTEDGIYLLNEQIVELAKSSEAAARVKLAANILEAKDAAIQASRAFEDTFDAGRLQFAIDTYSSGVGGLVGVSNEVVGVSRTIGEQFGLQGNAAIKFGSDVAKAIGDIQKAPTTGNFDAFINLISGQATSTGTKQTTALAGALLDLASKGRQAAQEAGNAQQAIDNLGAALDNTENKTGNQADALESFNRRLQLQNIALKDGELAANLQAAAWANGKDSVDELDAATKALVVENYNLAASQKYLAKSLKENNDELDRQARLDADAARRAERDKQRINERIANMRLETQTLSAESELQRAVKNGQFTQEEADLAAQTAARLLAANSEFEQNISMQGIQHEQIEAAEIAHKERIKAINEQYAAAQERLKQQQFNGEAQAYQAFANSSIRLIASFGSKSFQAQKNAAIATSLVNIAAGAAQAINNPYPANLGFAAHVVAEGATLVSAIRSTNLGSGGGNLAIGGGASATIPTAPTAAPVVGSFEIAGLADLQRQLDNLDNDEVLPVSFTRRLVASLESVQRLDGAS